MRPVHPVLLLALWVAALACRDGTGPSARRRALITNIRVPASAAATDTVHIAFDYLLGCDTLDVIDVRQTASRVSFAVWTRPTNGPCLASLTGGHVVHLLLPFRRSPFEAVFQEPSGADSVRRITTP